MRLTHPWRRAVLLTAAIATLVLGGTTAATAEPLPAAGAAVSSAAFPHCAQQLRGNGGAPGPVQCFATMGQAVAVALHDARYSSMSQSQVERSLAGLTASAKADPGFAAASYIIGIDYENTHYNGGSTSGGATYTWYGGQPCSPSYGYTNGAPSGWNNRVSSAASYGSAQCNHWVHYDVNVGSVGIDCGLAVPGGGCYEMGSMNDKTSFWKWYY